MPVDLHVHSSASDGSDSPAELVARAKAAGLSAMALTDHDTQSGVAAARRAAGTLEVIPGVELSVAWKPGTMHLLVLFLEPGRGPLQDQLGELRQERHKRNSAIIGRLRHLGIEIDAAELAAEAGGESPGRPHLAAILVRKGVVPDLPSAFDLFLAKGRPAYVDRRRLQPDQAIRLATASGAVTVLAHPHTIGSEPTDHLAPLLAELREVGLVGLECYYGSYLPEHRRELVALARSLKLVPSGGTDYHGTYRPDVQLGSGNGDLAVSEDVLEELRAARPR